MNAYEQFKRLNDTIRGAELPHPVFWAQDDTLLQLLPTAGGHQAAYVCYLFHAHEDPARWYYRPIVVGISLLAFSPERIRAEVELIARRFLREVAAGKARSVADVGILDISHEEDVLKLTMAGHDRDVEQAKEKP